MRVPKIRRHSRFTLVAFDICTPARSYEKCDQVQGGVPGRIAFASVRAVKVSGLPIRAPLSGDHAKPSSSNLFLKS